MERKELIQELKSIKPVMDRLDKHLEKIDNIEARIANLESQESARAGLWDTLFAISRSKEFLICFGIRILAPMIIKPLLSKTPLLGAPLLFIVGMAPIIGLILGYCSVKKKKTEKRETILLEINKRNAELEQAQADLQNDIAPYWGHVTSIIPHDYAMPAIYDRICSYLVNLRADNMKEAINLFETELHQRKLEDAEMRRLAAETRRLEEINERLKQVEFMEFSNSMKLSGIMTELGY